MQKAINGFVVRHESCVYVPRSGSEFQAMHSSWLVGDIYPLPPPASVRGPLGPWPCPPGRLLAALLLFRKNYSSPQPLICSQSCIEPSQMRRLAATHMRAPGQLLEASPALTDGAMELSVNAFLLEPSAGVQCATAAHRCVRVLLL